MDAAADAAQVVVGPQNTAQYQDALDFARRQVAEKDKNLHLTITFTGHSLGGGIAQFLNLELGVRTVVFNAAPLNDFDALLTKNLVERASVAASTLWNFRTRGDVVSASPGLQFGRVFTFDRVRPTTGQWWGDYSAHSVQVLLDSFNAFFLRGKPTIPSWWIDNMPGNSAKAVADSQMVPTMVGNAKRVLIVGDGVAARQMYVSMSQRIGSANTLWVHTYSSATDLQAQARTFNADAILGVRSKAPVAQIPFSAPEPHPPERMKPLPQIYQSSPRLVLRQVHSAGGAHPLSSPRLSSRQPRMRRVPASGQHRASALPGWGSPRRNLGPVTWAV